MRALFISAASLALAACGSSDSGTIETEDGEAAYDVDQGADGTVSGEFTGPDGETASYEVGANADVELPDGFSLYPGAQVVSSMAAQSSDGGGSMVVMNIDGSADDIIAYYRKEAEAAGVEIQSVIASNGSQIIGGESADGIAFSVNAFPGAEGKTTAQLVVGRGE